MMFRTAALLSTVSAVSAGKSIDLAKTDIKADSKLGNRILSASRRLDGADNFSWVAGYSIKFEQCAVADDQYYGNFFGGEEQGGQERNYNMNGMNSQQRLVKYSLCPTGTCDSGCSGGAQYVIDMGVFVEAYIESKLDAQEYNCEKVRENCYYDDEYQCYQNAGLDYCNDGQNNNNNNNQAYEFELQEAVECRAMDIDDEAFQSYMYSQGGGNQQYNRNGNGQQEMRLFVGPYCTANGKAIHLGTFLDEWCTYPAPEGVFEKFNYGQPLPYSAETDKSLIDSGCVSCMEPKEEDENNNGDQEDADDVLEICERLYEDAGKCESGLADGVTYYPNTYSCDFIKSLHSPGKMSSKSIKVDASKVFAGLFAATTVVFAGVAFHLYKKAQRTSVDLSSQGDSGALA